MITLMFIGLIIMFLYFKDKDGGNFFDDNLNYLLLKKGGLLPPFFSTLPHFSPLQVRRVRRSKYTLVSNILGMNKKENN